MGFNPPVPQRDSNWEIRVAVLLSLVFQVVLIFTGQLRKRSSSPLVRMVIWSCYLLADWVADLALGLLLNNMGNIGGTSDMAILPSNAALKHDAVNSGSSGGSPIIFAFWAPFLLLHLGGPDTITAYALADNELWLRHLVGLLFELSAAVVVFLCSLQGNPMILPTVLMFIAGIINGTTYRLVQAYNSRLRAGLDVTMVTMGDPDTLRDAHRGEGVVLSWAEYDGADEVRAYKLLTHFRPLFVNGVIGTKNRRVSEAFFLEHGSRNPMKAFRVVELELNYMYDMLYTKMPVLSTRSGYVLRFVGSGCVVSSLFIFGAHDKAGLLPVDAGVTYALLIAAVALEAAALLVLLFSDWTVVFFHQSVGVEWLSRFVSAIRKAKQCRPRRWTWPGTVWLMNLINHSVPMCMLAGCRHFVLKPLAIAADSVRRRLGPLAYTKKGKQEYHQELLTFIFDRISDTVTKATTTEERKMAHQARGQGALRDGTIEFESTGIVIQSVTAHSADAGDQEDMRTVSRCLSEYMLYLLLNKPEMMSATMGIGQLLYRNTSAEARLLFESSALQYGSEIIRDHQSACCSIVRRMSTGEFGSRSDQGDRTKAVLFNACDLANALIYSIADQEEMWRVVAHVWGEMLMFSAARTPARQHLRQLSEGGELITLVWFLMAHMGMSSSLFEVQDNESLNKLIIIDQ
ncbi:unnamed protein product [Urochloa decumbens]|uniref:DUF4220 domain-containing protein n=1 Tax=Urochloa decumbens TaxID=240449 RepID=A0ABC8WUA2_9POAL